MSSDKLSIVRKYLKENMVKAVHLEGCVCITCTYNYPHKEHMIELKHMDRSMEMTYGDGDLSRLDQRQLLIQILLELRAMHQEQSSP